MSAPDFPAWSALALARVEQALTDWVPAAAPARLGDAMRYAVLDGGKRLRPLLVLASAEAVQGNGSAALRAACAVELIHAYSLVHDDMPCMDNDVLRRGKPTVHVQYGEAQALLAGDALQALAFETLASSPLPSERRCAMLTELAQAAGASGMCGGQALDIDATGGHEPKPPADPASPSTQRLAALEHMHALKTGALLRCGIRLGALAAGVDAATRDSLDRYAHALGLAYQIRDDLLDVEGDSAQLGKTAGKDVAQGKETFPALLGIHASRDRLVHLLAVMQQSLSDAGIQATALSKLARQVVERSH